MTKSGQVCRGWTCNIRLETRGWVDDFHFVQRENARKTISSCRRGRNYDVNRDIFGAHVR